jgi:putative tRNA adenosine deaminase-associated protein
MGEVRQVSYFAAVLTRRGDRWSGDEVDLDDCESLDDIADCLRDMGGDVRMVLVEEDDEYAAIVRLDSRDDEPRAFLSDGRAADRYAMAALVAEDLAEVGATDDEDVLDDDDVPPTHDSTPFGDIDIVDDLGTPATDLMGMCEHQGTLPVDLLLAVCEKAGGGDTFEELRG